MSLFLAFSALPSSLVNRRKYVFILSSSRALISITVYKDIKQQKIQEQDMAGSFSQGQSSPSASMSYILLSEGKLSLSHWVAWVPP